MKAKDSFPNKKSIIAECAVFGGVFAVILALCLVFLNRGSESADTADVLRHGEKLYSLRLDVEQELSFPCDHGHIDISVKGGGIALTHSPCASQYCVHQGYKRKAGESILCAPEGVAVYLLRQGPVEEVAL